MQFVKRTVMREALVARGTYKFVPLAECPNDNIIRLTDQPSKDADARFTFTMPSSELFNRISMAKSMQVIDETGSGNKKIRVCEQPNWRDPNAFFRTIAAQTSIRFDREPRQTEVWFMVDDNKAQPRTQSTAATD